MARAIDEILGRTAVVQAGCDVTVVGRSERAAGGRWTTVVRLVRRNGTLIGERRLSAREPRCGGLRNPLALVVALVLEQDAPTLEVEVPPAPEPDEAPPSPPLANTSSAATWTTGTSAEAAVSWGLLPQPALGQAFGLAIGPADVLLARARLSFWLPTSTQQARPGGSFWAWYAGLELCPRLLDGARFELSWCAGVQGGAMMGEGAGLDVETSASRPYAHLDTSFRGSLLTLGSLRVVGELGLAVPFVRPRFVYRDQAERSYDIHRPSEILGVMGLGLEVRGGPAPRQEAR